MSMVGEDLGMTFRGWRAVRAVAVTSSATVQLQQLTPRSPQLQLSFLQFNL